jgi:hypothetical protein
MAVLGYGYHTVRREYFSLPKGQDQPAGRTGFPRLFSIPFYNPGVPMEGLNLGHVGHVFNVTAPSIVTLKT